MALDPQLLEILACPEDKGPLLYFADEGSLYNPRLKRRYAVRDDIPIMLIDEAETVSDAEDERLLAKAEADGVEPTFARSVADMTDSLGFLDAVAGAARAARGRARGGGGGDRVARPPRRGCRFATSWCSAWAAPGSPATCVNSVSSGTLPVPVTVMKQIRTPRFVGPGTLAFAVVVLGRHRGDALDGPRRVRGGRDSGDDLERRGARRRCPPRCTSRARPG